MRKGFQEPTFISVPSAATLCGVTRNTVFIWVKDGKLKAYQTPGRTNLIRPSDLVEFMEENGMFVPPELSVLALQDKKTQSQVGGEGADEQGPYILVVDDDPAIRAMVVHMLKPTYSVYQAETGYEALHLLTLHKQIAAILLDLRMPGQYGLNTLHEIKASWPDMPVCVVTGFVGEVPKNLLDDGTIFRLIRKPFRQADLHEAVGAMLKNVGKTAKA